jgi:adenine-specific DNA-methyltransferase
MNQDSNEPLIYETPSTSPDFKTELAAQLAELMPEVVADGKIDVVKLRELLGEDVGSDTERFGLFWPGKKRALRAAQEPTTATLRPDKANSKDWDTTQNVFIEGDNLEVLKILQKHYHNKIKLIYIDPPYNTGKDFVYPDNYKEGLETYLEWTRQVNEEGKKVSTNSESEGRYHSNWLNMMYPRLKLARNLLTNDGVICVSIDDHEAEHLKRLMSEVFGEGNFLAQLIWDKQHSQQQGVFKRYHEYVLIFARNATALGVISGGEGYIEAGALKKISRANPASEFKFPAGVRFDAPDGTELSGVYGDSEKVTVVAGKLIAEGGFTTEPVTLSAGWTQKNQMIKWFAGEETIDSKGQRVVEFYFNSAGKLKCRKERGVVTPPSILPRYGMVSEQTAALDALMGGHFFDTPKPVELIKDLVRWFTSDNDIVMDFFVGSGTTAHSVMDLNKEDGGSRRFIVVQLPEPLDFERQEQHNAAVLCDTLEVPRRLSELTKVRIRRVAEELARSNDKKIDLGFRSLKLADTNFGKWKVASDATQTALEQHLFSLRESSTDSATPDDLLIELLLKQGYSLTEKITESTASGLDVRIVGENLVIAYLTEAVKPTLDQLRALVDQDPQRIIMLEDAFHGDDELKTNLAQLCKSKGIELWTA